MHHIILFGVTMNYERVYRRTQIGEKQYEVFATMGKVKRQVGTIQTITTADKETSYAVYIREENGVSSVEVWTGELTTALKKYVRQQITILSMDLGIRAIQEFYDQACKVYQGTEDVATISEKIAEFARQAKLEGQKPLSDAT